MVLVKKWGTGVGGGIIFGSFVGAGGVLTVTAVFMAGAGGIIGTVVGRDPSRICSGAW